MRPLLGRLLRGGVSALTIAAITFSLLEGVLLLLRHFPALSRVRAAGRLAESLYFIDRETPQYLPECGRYDPEVSYTLRPGSCVFTNTEYTTRLAVNRLGVRDTEASLDAPAAIALGDSFAMGWGVEGEQTFAKRLEKEVGRRVLNTGVPSYGTARELKLLSRVDLSKARAVLIQFCDNDYPENDAAVRGNGRLRVMSRDEYDAVVRGQTRERRYVFGKYAAKLVAARVSLLLHPPAPDDSPNPDDPAVRKKQVENFVEVVRLSPVDLSRLTLVVFELNPRNRDTGWFLSMLRERLSRGGLPASFPRIVTVDVTTGLLPEDFYLLDDHLRPGGHEKVAKTLAPYLQAVFAADEPRPAEATSGRP